MKKNDSLASMEFIQKNHCANDNNISIGGTTNLYLAPIQSNLRPKLANSVLNPGQ